MRDRRSTNEIVERSGIKIEKNWTANGALGTPHVIGDEEEVYEGMAMADVWDERYEVNHCSEREEMPNQVER